MLTEKYEQSFNSQDDSIKQYNIHIIRAPEEERKVQEKTLEKIVAENFFKFDQREKPACAKHSVNTMQHK